MKLYEKVMHGDRRTVVKKYRKGEVLQGPGQPGSSAYVVKADIAMKVTEEFNAHFGKWYDKIYHLDEAVETDLRPEPTTMPGPLEPVEVPKKTWFDYLFGWLG